MDSEGFKQEKAHVVKELVIPYSQLVTLKVTPAPLRGNLREAKFLLWLCTFQVPA